MTMNTQQPTDITSIPLGAKLQSAREAQRLDRKDAAAKLRLNESVIDMIENNSFPTSMPPIFVRGYIRAYAKLLDVPEDVIVAGLEPIKPQPVAQDAQIPVAMESSRNYRPFFMKATSTAIAITLVGLVAAWWHNHANAPQPENIALAVPAEVQHQTDAAPIPAGLIVLAPTRAAALPTTPNAAPTVETNPLRATTPIALNSDKLASLTPAPTETPITPAAKPPAVDNSIPAYKRAAVAAATINKPVLEDNTEVD